MPRSLEFAPKVLGDRSPQLVPLVPKAFLHDVGALSEEMLAVLGAFGDFTTHSVPVCTP